MVEPGDFCKLVSAGVDGGREDGGAANDCVVRRCVGLVDVAVSVDGMPWVTCIGRVQCCLASMSGLRAKPTASLLAARTEPRPEAAAGVVVAAEEVARIADPTGSHFYRAGRDGEETRGWV